MVIALVCSAYLSAASCTLPAHVSPSTAPFHQLYDFIICVLMTLTADRSEGLVFMRSLVIAFPIRRAELVIRENLCTHD